MEKLVVIGGSAGCLQPLQALLEALPACSGAAIILVIHRQRNIRSHLAGMLARYTPCPLEEPDDKTALRAGHIYLAPQNYHLLVEQDATLSLEYSEPEHFSRPSIDITLKTAAEAFGAAVTAILLSGANADGAEGVQQVATAGGQVWLQNPEEAAFPEMPRQAQALVPEAQVLSAAALATHLCQLCHPPPARP